MITSAGIGSGLDINSIITQLMEVEREPLQRLDVQKQSVEAQLSAFGQIRGAVDTFQSRMSALQDIRRFTTLAPRLSDPDVLTATTDETAGRGTFRLDVLRLADNHRLASATTLASRDDIIGTEGDTMTLTVGENSFDVDIGGKSLDEVRSAINDAPDNAGLTASLIQDDQGVRLMLVADEPGSDNAVSLAYSGADPFAFNTLNDDRDESGSFTVADLDAAVTLEGEFTVTTSSNTVEDLIEGVTLNLKEPGTTTVSLSRDLANATAQIQGFVDAYNDLQGTITAVKDASTRADATPLAALGNQLAGVLDEAAGSGQFRFLSELGIGLQVDGTLALDERFLGRALETDFEGVARMFTDANQGVSARFENFARSLVAPGGLMDARTASLNSELRNLDRRIESVEFRLVRTEENLRRQFGALDALIAQLQQTSAFLTQQFETLPNSNSRG